VKEFTTPRIVSINVAKVDAIDDAFRDIVKGLEKVCPTGRALAIAKTKLEEAHAFAVKAVCQ
jgi:hypothetical protein